MRSRLLIAAILGAAVIFATELAAQQQVLTVAQESVVLAVPVGEGQVEDIDQVGLFDPANGIFFIGDGGSTSQIRLAATGQPIAGDFNCDGIDGVGVFDAESGRFLLDNDLDGSVDIEGSFAGGDRMLVGDFLGDDSCSELAVYNTRKGLMRIGDGVGPGQVSEDITYYFGVPGDEPFVGDFNNDGHTDLGLHRSSTGLVYLRTSHSTGFANAEFVYGNPQDHLVAGDWAGDGYDTVGIYRQSNSTVYLRNSNTLGVADAEYGYGNRSLVPFAGYFGELEGGDEPPPPFYDASDSCFMPAGVFEPTGNLIAIAAEPDTDLGTVTYSIEVEEGIGIDPSCFAAVVESILEDPRGWQRDDAVDFQLVTGGADFQVALASPATVDRNCAPLNTNGVYSCFNGIRTMINLTRWLNGATAVPTIEEYRQMVINHEVGHALGHGHVGCSIPGQPAPVMMQQTISIGGCLSNPWPLDSELTGG